MADGEALGLVAGAGVSVVDVAAGVPDGQLDDLMAAFGDMVTSSRTTRPRRPALSTALHAVEHLHQLPVWTVLVALASRSGPGIMAFWPRRTRSPRARAIRLWSALT